MLPDARPLRPEPPVARRAGAAVPHAWRPAASVTAWRAAARLSAWHPASTASVVAVALVAALVLSTLAAFAPAPALGATVLATRCDGVSLRTKPSTTSTRVAKLAKGTKVIAVAKVSGGGWRTLCAGVSKRGDTWWRITTVNGKSTSSRYGVKYVYAATSLFKVLYTTTELKAACDGVRLRTSPSTTATRKVTLSAGTRVTSIGSVSGGAWSTTCAGKAVSGSAWYKITAVNGKSVKSLYGVSALYGAKGLFVSASTVLPTPTPAPTATPTPTPTPTPASGYIEGIDVSHWQESIDWVAVAGSGKRFAFIKATDGIVDGGVMYVDPRYVTNRAQAKANGLLVGAYHFARPDTMPGDAVVEADHFIDHAAWIPGELLPVLDLETTGGLGTTDLQAWVKAFLDRIFERTGVRAIIYTSPSFWSNKMGNTTWFALNGYKTLWVAHWTPASTPTVPASNWGGNSWTFWQYTSDGTVPGIAGRVDLDRYRLADFSPVLVP